MVEISEHVKAVFDSAKVAIPQASSEPLSTKAAVVLPFPVLSNWTTTFWAIATGTTLSSTVTFALAVDTLPLLSVTVKVTVFVPTSEQTKSVWLKASVAIPQLSYDELLIIATVIRPCPLASRLIVWFWASTVGTSLSVTTTSKLQLAVFDETSVTVHITVVVPFGKTAFAKVALLL